MLAAAAVVTWTPSSRAGPVLRPSRTGATAVLLLDDDADPRSRLATGPKEGADDAGAGREPPAGFKDRDPGLGFWAGTYLLPAGASALAAAAYLAVSALSSSPPPPPVVADSLA